MSHDYSDTKDFLVGVVGFLQKSRKTNNNSPSAKRGFDITDRAE